MDFSSPRITNFGEGFSMWPKGRPYQQINKIIIPKIITAPKTPNIRPVKPPFSSSLLGWSGGLTAFGWTTGAEQKYEKFSHYGFESVLFTQKLTRSGDHFRHEGWISVPDIGQMHNFIESDNDSFAVECKIETHLFPTIWYHGCSK